jgi:acyl-CoA thioesterase-2
VHSLHVYFLRKGDDGQPVTYDVQRLREGRSFATRQVVASQGGETIFTMTASFQREESGFEHATRMPETPGPELLPFGTFQHAFEMRQVDPADSKQPLRRAWYRSIGSLPNDPAIHRNLLAYLSDHNLISAAMQPHALTWADIQEASLDHALWFHRPFRMDDWLLYVMDSPTASGARGLTRGQFFTQDGRLVASAAQEGLMRPK